MSFNRPEPDGAAATWSLIQGSLNVHDYKAFLQEFGFDEKADQARKHIELLEAWARVHKQQSDEIFVFLAQNLFPELRRAVLVALCAALDRETRISVMHQKQIQSQIEKEQLDEHSLQHKIRKAKRQNWLALPFIVLFVFIPITLLSLPASLDFIPLAMHSTNYLFSHVAPVGINAGSADIPNFETSQLLTESRRAKALFLDRWGLGVLVYFPPIFGTIIALVFIRQKYSRRGLLYRPSLILSAISAATLGSIVILLAFSALLAISPPSAQNPVNAAILVTTGLLSVGAFIYCLIRLLLNRTVDEATGLSYFVVWALAISITDIAPHGLF